MIGSTVFVARQAEMERLERLLARALEGEGQVCFVAGEAGAGKTTLVSEFTRRAQEANPELLVAFGDSNAQTGMADPYLPFREVMALLTGDVEGSLEEGVISAENADRLRRFLAVAAEALVESGADLVGIFVPGGSLLTRLGARLARGSRLAARLEALVKRKAELPAGPQGRLDQTQIFEQYTAVIRRLAEKAPLVLVIDDLHWVDAASVGLLFHLVRRLEKSRVMIVGTYRPNDLALGRGGERHPMDSVLNEIKRYHGDVVLALGEEAEGRGFVDALLDAEPNRLGPEFRDALYRHTEGHPLFTVELLRSLHDRGVLVRGGDGAWTIGPAVEWEDLPARVDGVIAERIGRLETELRDTLTVASVEGHRFTAEVIARVKHADARGVIRQLSGELERQHRLVAAQGTQRLATQRLSHYRFRHSLFQRYLYNALDEVERGFMHEDVARVLEELYGDECAQIAVQLARHFLEAGDTARAVHYLLCAGDTAAAAYANAEARLHYEKALELLEAHPDDQDTRRLRVDTTLKLVAAAYVADAPERSLQRLAAIEPVAAALPDPGGGDCGDRLRLARIRYWMGRFHFMANAPLEAIGYYRQVLEVAKELGDEEIVAIPSSVMGRAMVTQGHFGAALPLLEQAVAPMERLGNVAEWIYTQGFVAAALGAVGRYAEAIAAGEAAIRRSTEVGNLTALGVSHTCIYAVHLMAGDVARMLEASAAAIEAGERSGDRISIYVGHGYRAWAECRGGSHAAAAEHMARSREVARTLGPRLVLADWYAAVRAEIALRAGGPAEAAALAEEAVAFARSMGGIFGEGLAHQVWGEALAAADPPRMDEAEAHFAAALALYAAGGARLATAHLHHAWGRLLLEHGPAAAARGHLEDAAAQYELSGLAAPLAAARALLARAAENAGSSASTPAPRVGA
jgi:tetratricopeptide (TPR) repeat protein